MGLLNNILRILGIRKAQPLMGIRALPGGRASIDDVGMIPNSQWLIVPPSNYETNWQLINLQSKDFDQINPAYLLEAMMDLSPEISRAGWDFLRLMNPGWTLKVTRPGADDEYTEAQTLIESFIDSLSDEYGSFDIVLGRIHLSAFMRGALCAELVLDRRGRMPTDLATPDPNSIRFRKRKHLERGEVWQPGQWQEHQFVALDMPTFRYVPIDPLPSSPYGRPIAAPALFTAIFLLGVMHDLRRVIQQQGYPRIDLSIDVQQILESAPHLASDTDAFSTWVDSLVTQVSQVYSDLEPDDAYIHTSNIAVNRPVGTDRGSLGGIEAIITALERMAVRSLKTMPLMLGITENVGDVQSNRQWEIFVAGIKSIQHYSETMLERLLTLALEAQGVQASVEFRFSELRAAERLRDAQAEAMEIANEISKRDQGWQDQDTASEAITGSPAVADAPQQSVTAPEIVEGSTDGMQLNMTAMAQIRQAQQTVEQAIETVRTNGYHAPN